jgi:hypothetical protein
MTMKYCLKKIVLDIFCQFKTMTHRQLCKALHPTAHPDLSVPLSLYFQFGDF